MRKYQMKTKNKTFDLFIFVPNYFFSIILFQNQNSSSTILRDTKWGTQTIFFRIDANLNNKMHKQAIDQYLHKLTKQLIILIIMKTPHQKSSKSHLKSTQKSVIDNYNGNSGSSLYNSIINFDKFIQVPQLKNHEQIVKKFIMHEKHKVLFIFGPSGCGKNMLVRHFLETNHIPYKHINQYSDTNYDISKWQMGQTPAKSLRQLITQSTFLQTISCVSIYSQFPFPNSDTSQKQLQQIKAFRSNFFRSLAGKKCKIIFILNSQIYNQFYIMPRQTADQYMSLTMRPYKNTDIKTIVKGLANKLGHGLPPIENKDIMDQILEISNGDVRKVFVNICYRMLLNQQSKMKYMEKQQKNQYKLKLRNDQKFPLFHLIGKYLYAKRFDEVKKVDRIFSRKQLLTSDPPFYFDPIDLFLKSGVPLSTFTDLLFENYLGKIAQISDAKNILQIFCYLDSGFPVFITNKRVDSLSAQFQKMYIGLLTWGIILKNKSSQLVSKGFSSFRKSQLKSVQIQQSNKRAIIHQYYPLVCQQNLVKLAYTARNLKTSKPPMISSLLGKRQFKMTLIRDEEGKITAEDEVEIATENGQKNVNQFISTYQAKKKKNEEQKLFIMDIQNQGDQESDIDQEIN